MEFLMYPMDVLRITQGYGQVVDGVPKATYSHGHQPAALDQGGKDTGADWVFAPCSCIVKRVSTLTYNIVYFQSLEKVHCRDGVDRYVTFRFMHMNDSDYKALGIKVGKTFKQGEKCYREGQKGAPNATHLHSEFGGGQFSGTGCYYSGGGSWSINSPLALSKICWIKPETIVKNGNGYKWAVLTDAEKAWVESAANTSEPVGKTASNTAKSFNSAYKNGVRYSTTSNLNMRTGAGTSAQKMTVLPKGTKVMWYGYYTSVNGVQWKYVAASNGYTGFVSGAYLKA